VEIPYVLHGHVTTPTMIVYHVYQSECHDVVVADEKNPHWDQNSLNGAAFLLVENPPSQNARHDPAKSNHHLYHASPAGNPAEVPVGFQDVEFEPNVGHSSSCPVAVEWPSTDYSLLLCDQVGYKNYKFASL